MPDRRHFLRRALALGALPAALTLSGCKSLIDVLGQACPEDPSESGGIDWTPDVMHPVFFGFKDYTTADGAPSTLRVFHPSYQTPFSSASVAFIDALFVLERTSDAFHLAGHHARGRGPRASAAGCRARG